MARSSARLRFAVVVTVLASLPGLALAVGVKRHAAAPPSPPAPPPPITLALSAPAPDHGWEVKLTNAGTVPVRIVADPRLYSFEVTPPPGAAPAPTPAHASHRRRGAAPAGGPVKCVLPSEMIPSTDTERTLTLVAGRSWTVSIDPRMFCFSATQGAALVEGATVTTTFGWTASRAAPPYAVTPIVPSDVVDAGVGPARSISAPPVTLSAAPAPDGGVEAGVEGGVTPEPPLSDAYPVHLKVSLPESLDVSRVFEQSVTVSIANEGDRPVRTLFAPATVGFTIVTPRGTTAECGAPRQVSILPELSGALGPRGRTAVSLNIDALCPDVFRKPGLYRVRPRFDSTQATGGPAGHYYSGKAIGEPMLLRVRVGDEPLPPPRVDPP